MPSGGDLVVDSSTLVAALVDSGPEGDWAEAVLSGRALYAPHLLHAEVANVLRRLELARQITTSHATAAYEDLQQLQIELFPFEPFAERIWELRPSVTGYDAWYVALAEGLELPLATLDARLVNASGPTCRFLAPNSRRTHRVNEPRA